jgi:Flp pilus assembly protein TadG
MKTAIVSFIRKAFQDQSGQLLPMIAIGMIGMLAVGGLTIDVGHAYVVRQQIQMTTNAAGLAAAGNVYDTGSLTDATAEADTYSSQASGDKNYISQLGPVTTTVTQICLNMLMSGTTCAASGNLSNAVRVTQSTEVPTFFMRIFGVNQLLVGATATASMQGVAQPWNVAIIVDTTGSMATVDSNCGGLTELQCSLSGVQTLLQATPPCPGGQTGTSCISGTNSNMNISMFTFPPVLTSYNGTTVPSISDDLNCGGSPATYNTPASQPIAAPYILPKPGAVLPGGSAPYLTYVQTSTGKQWKATYQITPFLSDYYSPASTATGGLNASSQLVEAVGYTSSSGAVHSGCLTYTFGVDGSGSGSGFGNTYFAGAIYMAQSAIVAEQAAVGSTSKNAIIFLSDGQANATYYSKNTSGYTNPNVTTNQYYYAYQFPEGAYGSTHYCPPASGTVPCAEVGPSSLNPNTGTWPATPAYYTPATILPAQKTAGQGYDTLSSSPAAAGTYQASTTHGIYPDWYDQCQQAIVAANYASTAGTRMYAVAYGSESSGCGTGWSIGLTDNTASVEATGSYTAGTISSSSSVLPCTTMEDIASSWDYFYSDNQQTGNVNLGCTDNNHTSTSLADIFKAIAATFTTPRLLPNDAT